MCKAHHSRFGTKLAMFSEYYKLLLIFKLSPNDFDPSQVFSC